MSEKERIGFVRSIKSLEDLASMKANVIARSGWSEEFADAFKQRELEIYEQKVVERLHRRLDSLSLVERKIVRGLAALWMTQDDHFPPNRSFQAIRNRDGDLIRFAEDVVSNRLESNGYRRLMAAGFDDLVFERMVLDHPEVFSEKTCSKALDRLNELDSMVAEPFMDEEDSAFDSHATKQLLEDMGFEKPQATAWYALRGDSEIVFLSWVREADFERGVARILTDEGDRRPNFYHWRSQIQKIKAGEYRRSYIVFGYKGAKNANVQHDSQLRLYRMVDIQEIGREIFATFVPSDLTDQGDSGEGAREEATSEGEARSPQFTTAPVRPEQAAFRRALFERFNGRCALTGCAVAELLDAAHLPGRNWALERWPRKFGQSDKWFGRGLSQR